MNELEQQLMNSLRELSEQYSADMQRLPQQNTALSQRVETLSGQVQTLTKALQHFNKRLGEALGA